MSALISAAELHQILGQPHVKIVDGSYGLPPSDAGIAGTVDFDIDAIADLSAPLPHTIPSPAFFAEKVGALGISNADRVIVYDRVGMAMSAARVWWMFRLFGHDNVQVLNGGLPAWVASGFSLVYKNREPEPEVFKASFRPELFKSLDAMKDNLSSPAFQVLDARDARRYRGEMPEPRPGIESGHIPGAVSTPFADLINPANGHMKAPDELNAIFKSVDLQKPIACSCGSGVTACVVALGLFEVGKKDAAIYGGSWTEWGANPALPKNKGDQP